MEKQSQVIFQKKKVAAVCPSAAGTPLPMYVSENKARMKMIRSSVIFTTIFLNYLNIMTLLRINQ